MEIIIDITKVLVGSQDGLQDVVNKIYYNITASKDGHTYTTQNYVATLGAADPNIFIPYSNLTKQQMEDMIKSTSVYQGLVKHIENILDTKIQEQQLNEKPLPF